MRRLLADIEAGRVDCVVTYKLDRLSRSLTDFVRLMERLDAHEVTFVSVTQAFNTTTSMGRLTLNILLSFAQFEREVSETPDATIRPLHSQEAGMEYAPDPHRISNPTARPATLRVSLDRLPGQSQIPLIDGLN